MVASGSFHLIWSLSCVLLMIFGTDATGTCFIKTLETDTSNQLQDLSNSVNIIEFDFVFENYSSAFWRNVSENSWFKPTRMYRCKTQTTERFLLLFHYYYGLFKSYAIVGLTQWQITIITEPLGCLNTKSSQDIQHIFNNFILSNFVKSNGSNSVEISDLSVCSMQIFDKSGWAYFGYRCCRKSSAGELDCYEVTDDIWTWVLRALILTATVIIFLYFPILIPKSFRVEVFSFFPQTPQMLNILTTRNQKVLINFPETLIVPFKKCKKMKEFSKLLAEIPSDIVHKLQVKSLDFRIKFDRILAENEIPFGLFRALFDTFIRCKIRHNDDLEDCCTTRICGQCSCSVCPQWYVLVRAIRTVLIFLVLALPSVPLIYHMWQPEDDYMEITRMTKELCLKQANNFSIHTTAGIAIAIVIAVLYVVHIIVVVVDEVRDRNLGKLYGQLLSSQNARSSLTKVKKKVRSVIRSAVLPLQKLGILFLPLWIVFLILSPVIIFIYFIVTSPVFQVGLRILRLLLGTFENSPRGREELEHKCENLTFCLTIFALFVVLTIGFNFLFHVVTMIIINMIVNITFTMRILPVVILIAFYIRDTFSNVGATYHSYSKIILGLIMGEKTEEVREVASKHLDEQDNVVFHTGSLKPDRNDSSEPVFSLTAGQLFMNTKGLVLFLHREDMPYLSKEFFQQSTEISCHGSPGQISESVKAALYEFIRIILFLFCLLIIVMAYGDITYISPEGQFFATFITGLIPFALKKFFLNGGDCGSLDTGNLRFATQFDELKNTFEQRWPLDDIIHMTEQDKAKPKLEPINASGASTSTWSMEAILAKKQKPEKNVIDLVVDMSDFDFTADMCALDQEGKETEPGTCGKLPCLKPISVSP